MAYTETYTMGGGAIEVQRRWNAYSLAATTPELTALNGEYTRLHSLLSRVFPEKDFDMKTIKDQHVNNVSSLVGLDPIVVQEAGLAIGSDNEGRDVKVPFNVIVTAIHGALLANKLVEIQHADKLALEAEKQQLEALLVDVKAKGSKASAIKQRLSPEDAHDLHLFFEASANTLKHAKTLGSSAQGDLAEFLASFAGVDASQGMDHIVGTIVGLLARTPKDYMSVRGDLGTMTHAILEAQLKHIKESGVWEYTPAITAEHIPNANPRCIAAAQLTLLRLQSDLGVTPSDILGLETTAVLGAWGAVGTADLILRIGGKATVVDYKTQRTLDDKIAWQLASYSGADLWITESDVLTLEHPVWQKNYEADMLSLTAKLATATTDSELREIQASIQQCIAAKSDPEAKSRVRLPSGELLEIADTALVIHIVTEVDEDAEVTATLTWALSNAGPKVMQALSTAAEAAMRVDEQLKQFEGRGRIPLLTETTSPAPVLARFGITKDASMVASTAKPTTHPRGRTQRASTAVKPKAAEPKPDVQPPKVEPVAKPVAQRQTPQTKTASQQQRPSTPVVQTPPLVTTKPAVSEPIVSAKPAGDPSPLSVSEKNMLAYIHQFATTQIEDEQERLALARYLEQVTKDRHLSRKEVVQMYNEKTIVMETSALAM